MDNACTKVLGLLAELEHGSVKVDAFNFDRVACSLMHEEMRLPPRVAASDGFWRWLAVAKLSDVIEARHRNSAKGVDALLGNYGIDAPDYRNRLRILWLRADMLYDADAAAPDPYHLAKRFLRVDFIESGIIRHRWGWCRNLARVLVGFQYPNPESKEVYRHSRDALRKLYKRLQRLHSVYAFEFMSDQELCAMLEKHSQDLGSAL